MDRLAKEQIERAPDHPGVYLFKGKEGKVLYVGKAKRLNDRLKAYLVPGRDERPSVALLVPQVVSVDWILTDSEKEALLLENSLIKAHRPRYNILLKDDKSYVSLRLTSHRYPRLFVTRKIIQDGSEYFGPYSSAYDLRQTFNLIQKIFRIRDCTDHFYANRSRPCLQFQIKRCTAPCVGMVTEQQYSEQIRQARLFLKGEKRELIEKLKEGMALASEKMKYEEAAVFRDRISGVTETLEPQQVESNQKLKDSDAIGLAGDQDATLIKVLKVRGGRMVGTDEFLFSEPASAASEIIRAFIHQFYLDEGGLHRAPSEIFIQTPVADVEGFEAVLSERNQHRVKLIQPKRGRGARLVKLAEKNALFALAERKRRSEQNEGLLNELKTLLRLSKFPKRIEGYDISNLFGKSPYGSMVVFIDGEADKTKYRYFKIKTVKGANDFAMLKEVFERRLRKLDEENRPDFILVDGGKGQLKQLMEILKELNVSGLNIASIAKEKELKSRSGKKYAPERIFLPGQKNPIIFAPSSPVLHLLQRVRDEAHRFGITRHRKSRGKVALTSILSSIKGVGAKRMKLLQLHLKSLEAIKSATVDELASIQGISRPVAEQIHTFFRAPSRASNGEE